MPSYVALPLLIFDIIYHLAKSFKTSHVLVLWNLLRLLLLRCLMLFQAQITSCILLLLPYMKFVLPFLDTDCGIFLSKFRSSGKLDSGLLSMKSILILQIKMLLLLLSLYLKLLQYYVSSLCLSMTILVLSYLKVILIPMFPITLRSHELNL